ncbi:hypothetical protein BASA81_010135 [Batrachochytrium salamandrivorans]|nr:hypothetical protein BASA81_010135 [Batrachochytrium salamandrivorans]
MPKLQLEGMVREIADPRSSKLDIITRLVEFVRVESHAQILYASDEVCSFVIWCCLVRDPPLGMREIALESMWNIVHSNADKRRLLKLDGELISHLVGVASHPQVSQPDLGNALGTLLEFSMDEFCTEEIFSHRALLLRLLVGESELVTGLVLQIVGNVAFGSVSKQNTLFPLVFDLLLGCVQVGILQHDGASSSTRIVALALWNLLMFIRSDTAEYMFRYPKVVWLLIECAETGTIRIQEKAVCALCVFTKLPQLAREIAANQQLVGVFTQAMEFGKVSSIKDMGMCALANLCLHSPPILLYLQLHQELLLKALTSQALLFEAGRALKLSNQDLARLEQLIMWLCSPERSGLTWARNTLLMLDAPELTRKYLPLPPGHTHFSWWQNQSTKLPPGQTKFSW